MSEQKSTESKTVEVTLTRDHTHAGRRYQAGEKIRVTEPEKAWLVAQEIVAGTPAKETSK